MESAGFARAGVPGEYTLTPVTTRATANLTSTLSFAQVLSATVIVETPGEVVNLVFSSCSAQIVSGGDSSFEITVDGVVYSGCSSHAIAAGYPHSNMRVLPIIGLSVGSHVIKVLWSAGSGGARMPIATSPNAYSCSMVIWRNRPTSDREMDGFVQRGWQSIYTEPQQFFVLTSPNTSTSSSIDTSLFTGANVLTRYAQSALLIRFSACGMADGTAQQDVIFQIYVDGQAVVGTGANTAIDGFLGGVFNAGAVVLVPVQAGNHTIDVLWSGGGGSGCTIDPNSIAAPTPVQHAVLSVEEVVCLDANGFISDMEGFATAAFASRNLPRVAYASLQDDFTNGATDIPLLEQLFYVSGEQSALQVESTTSLAAIDETKEATLRIVVDGVNIVGCTNTALTGFKIGPLALCAVVPACQGNHLVQLFINGLVTVDPATHPEYSHANMVMREVAPLAA